MDPYNIDDLIDLIKAADHVTVGHGLIPPMTLQSAVRAPVRWVRSEIESTIGGTLPDDFLALWSTVSEIRLHEDVNYGQWGCILWSPLDVVAHNVRAREWRGPEAFTTGDLIIGEFRGDADLVVVRCDSSQPDFGSVVIALAMDARSDWPRVSASIIEFIREFLAHPKAKFWEVTKGDANNI